jgi:hypothetical protein
MQHQLSGRMNLTRSQSDALLVTAAIRQPFIVAAWRGGEAIIQGWGASPWAASNIARRVGAPTDSELCSRVTGETMVWRGPSGRHVTVEDFLSLDD